MQLRHSYWTRLLKAISKLNSDSDPATLAERARKRRFDSHQLMRKIAEIDSQLMPDATNIELRQQGEILVKTRAILMSEYPRDAQRAIALSAQSGGLFIIPP